MTEKRCVHRYGDEFSPPRVREIVRGRQGSKDGERDDVTVMSRLHVVVQKRQGTFERTEKSESYVIEYNVGIVILDSMAFHVLREFPLLKLRDVKHFWVPWLDFEMDC